MTKPVGACNQLHEFIYGDFLHVQCWLRMVDLLPKCSGEQAITQVSRELYCPGLSELMPETSQFSLMSHLVNIS